jgi:hypothetical protein
MDSESGGTIKLLVLPVAEGLTVMAVQAVLSQTSLNIILTASTSKVELEGY